MMPQASPLYGHARGNDIELCCRTQHENPFLGMVATAEARDVMRSYFTIVVLIVGLVGAYLALLPLTV
jgi:H+/Cl- antiporter ClcA